MQIVDEPDLYNWYYYNSAVIPEVNDIVILRKRADTLSLFSAESKYIILKVIDNNGYYESDSGNDYWSSLMDKATHWIYLKNLRAF